MKDCHEVTEGEVIAIDGKTLRATYNKDKRCGEIHMVSAANQVVLGQVKPTDKSNEIIASLELLEMRGCLVTLGASD
ncbi:transposase (fragment) [Vibrio crassostreae]